MRAPLALHPEPVEGSPTEIDDGAAVLRFAHAVGGFDQRAASAELDIPRSTLNDKLRRYKIDPKEMVKSKKPKKLDDGER